MFDKPTKFKTIRKIKLLKLDKKCDILLMLFVAMRIIIIAVRY